MGYEKLYKLLCQKKITVYRLAKDTCISTVTFTNWKKGRYKPKVNKLLILAKYFDVPIEYFLED